MKFTPYISIIVLLFCSCRNKEQDFQNSNRPEIINVSIPDHGILTLSELYQNFNLIKLQSRDKTGLINYISKMQVVKDRIFILSNNTILCFKLDGSYLSSLDKKGKGPGEYSRISDFFIDTLVNCIEINDDLTKKIIRYSYDGNFLDEWKHNFFVNRFIKINNYTYVFYCSSFINSNIKKRIIFVNREKGEVQESHIDITDEEAWYLYIMDNTNFITSYNGTNQFLYSQCDTIYSITSKGIIPNKVIHYAGQGIPQQLFKERHEDIFQFMQALNKTNYTGLIDNYYDTDSWIYFTVKQKGNLYHVIFNKDERNSKVADKIMDDMMFREHNYSSNSSFWPKYSSKNMIYYSLDPGEYKAILDSLQHQGKALDKKLVAFGDSLSFLDNPVLIRFEIKANHK
ncbi:MAG: 6-bladed beta-propeller [Bacteroidales bacterium]|nr:6-bladed beta-propeller [Bacteroidales bacterium]